MEIEPADPDDEDNEIVDDNNTETNDIDQAVPIEKQPECSINRGGCDHECEMIAPANRSNATLIVRCTCFKGYLLDQKDGRTCHGKEINTRYTFLACNNNVTLFKRMTKMTSSSNVRLFFHLLVIY